jgi:hypothetical protein
MVGEDQASVGPSGGSSRRVSGRRGRRGSSDVARSREVVTTRTGEAGVSAADRVIGRGEAGSGAAGSPQGAEPRQGNESRAGRGWVGAFVSTRAGLGVSGASDGQQHAAPLQRSAQPQWWPGLPPSLAAAGSPDASTIQTANTAASGRIEACPRVGMVVRWVKREDAGCGAIGPFGRLASTVRDAGSESFPRETSPHVGRRPCPRQGRRGFKRRARRRPSWSARAAGRSGDGSGPRTDGRGRSNPSGFESAIPARP